MSAFVSRYALGVVIVAVVLLAFTGNLVSSSPVVIAIQILAVALTFWARRSFPSGAFRVVASPSADNVIRSGPYRLIRHPMYAGTLLFLWASVISHPASWIAAVGGIVTIIVGVRIVFEERFLRDRYPDYAVYASKTKAVVPYLL